MSGLVGEFVKGLRGLKVKELAPYVGGYARTNLTPGALYGRAYEHIHLYKKHLDQGSVKPLFDTMGLLFVGAYALAWPTVRMEGGREREKRKDLRRASTMGFSLSSLDAPSSFALLSFSHCCTRFLPYLSGPLSRECGRVAAGVVEKTRKKSQTRIFGDKERPFGPPPFFSSSFLRSLAVALFSFFNLDLDPFFSLTNSLSFPASEPKKTTHRSTPTTRLSRRPSSRASPEGTREREKDRRGEREISSTFYFFRFLL
jgi:hypothetical protein